MRLKFHISTSSFLILVSLFIGIITSIPVLIQNWTESGKVLSTKEQSIRPTDQKALVTYVVDGDTIKVLINGQSKTIRLIGIDSPESVHPQKPVECFGKEAAKKLHGLIFSKTIYLRADASQDDQDKYGRLLRYVLLPDGTHVNAIMIEQGYAYEYTYDDPYEYNLSYKKAQLNAELNKQGLWADDACVE